jgi:hypothetical protein
MPIFLIFEDWWQKIKGCATVTNVVQSCFIFFRPCVGKDTLFDKLWQVRLA